MKNYYFLITLFVLNLSLKGQTPFEFNGQFILSGTKQHFSIQLSDGQNEALIPISVLHGKTDGKVLGITAGVHGYEYAPILAGQELIQKIDPASLKGTIIFVQIANMSSFLGRSPYTNPNDGINLNRAFPGDSEGSITARIADFISQKVIGRSDYFVDMHSGDAPEDLMAYAAYYQHDDFPKISEKGRQIIAHMGFEHVVVFKTTSKDYMKADYPSLYCSAEAFKQGIPSIDIECGRLGIVEQPYVDKIVEGVEGMLKHLGFVEGTAIVTEPIAFIEDRFYLSSEHTGFFYPAKSSGDYVIKGMPIGQITDFFGQPLQTVRANADGVILYMLGTPPINKGETISCIGAMR